MPFTSGAVLGQYRIDQKLGSGGMGEVYKARHIVLGRDVALKTFRPGSSETEARLRLIQEARAASVLHHPNIVAVYDIADVEGTLYIAMEYVDGQTLREVLKNRTLRPLEAIRYAEQIANALAAAHAVGLLHRDVKPGNIMITNKNVVKVVDFGLARHYESSAMQDDSTMSMNIDLYLTKEGSAVGTRAYMSPEQLRAHRLDARSDIFSFGIVLYEMLTGHHPFATFPPASTESNILDAEPRPLHDVVPALRHELGDLVEYCLRKEPENRAQSMQDLAHVLGMIRGALERSTSETAKIRMTGNRRFVGLAALAMALLLGWAAGQYWMQRGGHPARRPVLRRITGDAGLSDSPALSSDGRLLAFASDRANSKSLDLFVRHTSGGEPIRLTSDPADDRDPSFSPDGGIIAFRSERNGGGIYIVPSLGGPERLIAAGGNNPRFSPDGEWITYWVGEGANTMPSGRIYVVPSSGGSPRQLQPSFADARYPVWTPDAKHIMFQGVDAWQSGTNPRGDWWVTPLDSGKAIQTGTWDVLTRAGLSYIYEPGGWHDDKVVFSAQDDNSRSLFEVRISPRTWRVEGTPESLTFGTGSDGSPCPAQTGIAFVSYQYEINIWSRKLDKNDRVREKENVKVTAGAAFHSSISANANETRMAFLRGRSPRHNVWVRDMVSGREASVDIDPADKCSAILSADGSRVAWSACGARQPIAIAALTPDLSVRMPETICEDCGRVLDWSPASDSILFSDHSSPANAGILTLSSRQRNVTSLPRHNLDNGHFSPDGNWVALRAAETSGDRAQIMAIPVKDGRLAPNAEWVPITSGEFWDDTPVWTGSGDALLFYSRRDGFGCIWRQAVDPFTKRPKGSPSEVLAFHGARLSPKALLSQMQSLALANHEILFNALESTGSIWMLDYGRSNRFGQ